MLTHDFEPTGDPMEDTPAWERLVRVVNKWTPKNKSARIRLADNGESLELDAKYSKDRCSVFSRGCVVRGRSRNCRIAYNDGYIVNWGGFGNPMRTRDDYQFFRRGTIERTLAFTSRIVSKDIEIKKGDRVVVWSEDNLPDVAPHHSGGAQRAAELHRVDHPDGGGWVLDSDIVDPLLTNPRVCVIEMLPRSGMEHLTFGSNQVENADPNTPQLVAVSAQRCHRFILDDVESDETGSGAVGLTLCTDSRVRGFDGVGHPNNRRVYAVVFSVCTDCVYEDSTWHNTRHMLTSGGLQVDANDGIRYGTARGCQGRNLHQWISGDVLDWTFAGFDLHAETWGFEFFNCHIHNAMWWDNASEEFIGFSTRSRRTRFIHCVIHSAMTQSKTNTTPQRWYGQPATGFRIMGNDAVISNCHQDRGWRGVWIRPDIMSADFIPQRTKIEKSTFDDLSGPAIYMDAIPVRDVELLYSTIRRTGAYFVPSGNPEFNAAAIRLRGGSGHKLRFNSIDKHENQSSIDLGNLTASEIDITYNSTKGHGPGKLGVLGLNAAAIETRYAGKNSTD